MGIEPLKLKKPQATTKRQQFEDVTQKFQLIYTYNVNSNVLFCVRAIVWVSFFSPFHPIPFYIIYAYFAHCDLFRFFFSSSFYAVSCTMYTILTTFAHFYIFLTPFQRADFAIHSKNRYTVCRVFRMTVAKIQSHAYIIILNCMPPK